MKWAVIFLFFLLSCGSEKKIAKAKNTLNKYDAGSGYCSVMFPCQDTTYVIEHTVFDTVTLQNEPFVITETRNDTVYLTQTLPGKVITKYITRDSIVIRRDNAKEAVLQSQVSNLSRSQDKLITEKDDYKSSAGKWRGYALITWGILLAFIIGWILAKIYAKK